MKGNVKPFLKYRKIAGFYKFCKFFLFNALKMKIPYLNLMKLVFIKLRQSMVQRRVGKGSQIRQQGVGLVPEGHQTTFHRTLYNRAPPLHPKKGNQSPSEKIGMPIGLMLTG